MKTYICICYLNVLIAVLFTWCVCGCACVLLPRSHKRGMIVVKLMPNCGKINMFKPMDFVHFPLPWTRFQWRHTSVMASQTTLQLCCLFKIMFQPTTEITWNLRIIRPCVGIGGFPSSTASEAECLVMPWLLHATAVSISALANCSQIVWNYIHKNSEINQSCGKQFVNTP